MINVLLVIKVKHTVEIKSIQSEEIRRIFPNVTFDEGATQLGCQIHMLKNIQIKRHLNLSAMFYKKNIKNNE